MPQRLPLINTILILAAAILAAAMIPFSAALADNHPCQNPDSLECTRNLAENGDAEAQYNLGISYFFGKGIIENKYESYIWVSIAKANEIE
ncbi:MAG: hypothetical protein ACR2P5_06585 [Gammaproteobacteria bacterium]